MRKLLLAISLLTLTLFSFSATSGSANSSGSSTFPTYTKAQLTQDLLQMQNDVETTMVNPWVFCTQAQFETAVQSTIKQLKNGENSLEFYAQIAPLGGMIQSEHVGIVMPTSTQVDTFLKNATYCPVQISYIGNSTLVVKNIVSIPNGLDYAGYSIISINHHSLSDIISKTSLYFSSEIPETRIEDLAQPWIVQPFIRYYNFSFGFDKKYTLVLKSPSGKVITLTVPNATHAQFLSLSTQISNNTSENSTLPYSFKLLPNNVGLLTYTSCINVNSNFQDFISGTAITLNTNKCKNLIIDIRGNGGGNSDSAEYILDAFTNKPFLMSGGVVNKISPLFEKEYLASQNYWGMGKDNFLAYCTTNMNKTTAFYGSAERSHFINGPLWTGNIYLLTDDHVYSSAIMMASAVKDFKLGYIIGQPTGGAAANEGDILTDTLKNSQLSIYIPFREWQRTNGLPSVNQPIYPDYFSNNALQDAQTMIANLQKMGIN